jgi:GT2 family glycosyltransferase
MDTTTRQDLLSVVVAVRNGASTIERCVRSLTECVAPAGFEVEILVVDDGSTDATAELVACHPGVRLLRQPPMGASAARNHGIRESRGAAVAFTDADCEVDRAWLIELVNCLRATDAAAAGGSQSPPDDARGMALDVARFLQAVGFFGGYTRLAQVVREVDHNPSCNSVYRRTALVEVGGFSGNLWPGEDVELDLRIGRRGHRIVYNPRARVRHHRRDSLESFARMMLRYGRWSGGYLTRHYGMFRPLSWAPLVLLLLLGALVVAALLSPALAIAGTAVLALVPLLLFRRSAAPLGAWPRMYLLAVIAVIAWHAGYLRGLFTSDPPRPGLAVVAGNGP